MESFSTESLNILRQKVLLFEAFSLTEVMQLLQRARQRQLPAGYVMIEEGSVASSMFIVIRGRAIVSRSRGDGRDLLAILDPGATAGEMAIIDQAPRSARVVTEGEAAVIELDAQALMELPPPLLRKMYRNLAVILARRLRVANETRTEEAVYAIDAEQLRRTEVSGWNLSGIKAKGADLSCADFRRADLRDADLRGADLRGVRLDGADLRQTDLSTAMYTDPGTRPPDPFTDSPAAQDSWEQLMKSLATRAKKDKGES